MEKRIIRYGMVGGHLNAFIGGVHRIAIGFDQSAELFAGCFSPIESENTETAERYHLDRSRVYKDYKEMAQKESQRDDKIDFVAIVTPNFMHYEVAKEFLLHGIHVMCEKPLCFEVDQALELQALAKEKGLLFAVDYAYTGNAMIKLAKQFIADGEIGDIVGVSGEYLQEWLIDELGEQSDTIKLSGWRTNPKVAGISNCIGDIGTHIESMVHYITGLTIKRISAKLQTFGHPLELNADILVDYDNGASGVYACSQVAIGHMNDLSVRIFGTKGALEWRQEYPNDLRVTRKGQPPQLYSRGAGYVTGRAAALNRLPSGHPEGYFEAIANIYKTFAGALAKKNAGIPLDADDLDFPRIESGISGVRFIHAAVESGKNDSRWVSVEP
ncbi:Gfo/Idh/MocA family protein [Ethanoligenens sp.]|uniref:Gfo/Idh/MocA family protein n=1 Tax=Ethanoligenens sp. TaxID=2099655 RepID=UPI0039EACEB4